MGLNGHSYWISAVISNNVGNVAVVELAGTPAWQDGTTIGQASIVTPQSVWLGTVGGGEPILRSNRIVIPMYYRYDTGGSGSEPFVGCIYSDDGVTFSRGMLSDETQAAVFGDGGQTSGMLEPHFTELTTNNHLYISCNTKGSYHGHMTSTDGGQTWTAGLDDGTGGSTLLQVASTPAPVVALGGGEFVMVMPDDSRSSVAANRLSQHRRMRHLVAGHPSLHWYGAVQRHLLGRREYSLRLRTRAHGH